MIRHFSLKITKIVIISSTFDFFFFIRLKSIFSTSGLRKIGTRTKIGIVVAKLCGFPAAY
jgi:hypothetical protein